MATALTANEDLTSLPKLSPGFRSRVRHFVANAQELVDPEQIPRSCSSHSMLNLPTSALSSLWNGADQGGSVSVATTSPAPRWYQRLPSFTKGQWSTIKAWAQGVRRGGRSNWVNSSNEVELENVRGEMLRQTPTFVLVDPSTMDSLVESAVQEVLAAAQVQTSTQP